MRHAWLLLAVAGCARKAASADEHRDWYVKGIVPVLEKHRAPSLAILAALKDAPALAAAAPPVEHREPLGANHGCGGDNCVSASYDPKGGYVVTGSPSLVQFDKLDTILKGDYPPDGVWQQSELQLTELEKINTLVIVRPRTYQPPVASANDHFIPGRATGDVVIYELPSKQRIGGFPYEIRSGDVASFDAKKDVQTGLDDSFRGTLAVRTHEQIADYFAGKATPDPAGDDATLRERQITEILGTKNIHLMGVEIADGPPCKVVLVALLPAEIALHGAQATDGEVVPAALDVVHKVTGKDCVVTYRDGAKM